MQLTLRYNNKRSPDVSAMLLKISKEVDSDLVKRIPVLLKMELKRYLQQVAKELMIRHSNPWPGGTTPHSLSSRSGKGRRSIGASVKVKGGKIDTIQGKIGGKHYLRAHEYGAIITPKRKKYLTIPLPPALTNRGVPKKKSARDWKNTFVATSKKGNLIIFQKKGKRIIPLYVLKKRVVIRPRLKMRETLERNIGQLESAVAKILRTEF